MGDGVPTSLRMRAPGDDGAIGTIRNLQKHIKSLDTAANAALDFVKGGQNVLRIVQDIYQSADVPSADGGNRTHLIGERFSPGRERDLGPPQPSYGGGIKGISLRLKDAKLLPDFGSLTLFGEASATLEIPTNYPPQFDTPTEIHFKLTSTSIRPSQVGVAGTATMFKILQGSFKIQLHYDERKLLETIIRFAKKKGLTRAEVEQLLRNVNFDASAIVKIGFLPISYIKLGANSILPMRRPVLGATDESLPVQIASMPGREMFVAFAQTIPKGVFFDVPVPGFGLHYSKFGEKSGVSATAAGLAKPDLVNFGQVKTFGYVDLHYAKRVSNSVDVNVGITYTYSRSGPANTPEPVQLRYLHARNKSWLPETRDNEPAPQDRSGHNFMFSIKGTFDLL